MYTHICMYVCIYIYIYIYSLSVSSTPPINWRPPLKIPVRPSSKSSIPFDKSEILGPILLFGA